MRKHKANMTTVTSTPQDSALPGRVCRALGVEAPSLMPALSFFTFFGKLPLIFNLLEWEVAA